MNTCFEDLCNELLLVIFVYINPRHLYQLFWNLNYRLNVLLASMNNLQLIIDEVENNETIIAIASHVVLLQVNTWDDIDLTGFGNLCSLALTRPSPSQLKQIRAETMPKLTHLSLYSNVYFIAPKQLIHDAFSNAFSSLRWARLGHIDLSDLQSRTAQSLRHLHISCSTIALIPFLLASCPRLHYLHVDICRDSDQITIPSPNISNHPLRQFLLRDYCLSTSSKDILSLLSYIPNTQKIELKFNYNAPVIFLLKHLSDSLRYLHRFNCDITECSIQSSINLAAMQQIHPCFSRIRCRTQTKDFRIFSTD